MLKYINYNNSNIDIYWKKKNYDKRHNDGD